MQVGPTGLWRIDGQLVGICPNSMLALSSELEGVGREGLQVLQKVEGGRLKAHFLLKGDVTEYRRSIHTNLTKSCNEQFFFFI